MILDSFVVATEEIRFFVAGFDEKPIIDLGSVPLPGEAPCGVDPADDEDYIRVQAELGKLDRIDADEPDWYELEQCATRLLATKSKDIDTASALGFALFKQHRYPGLAAVLGLLDTLVSNYWDQLFPARPRRRKTRIETLTDRFSQGGWFRENQPGPGDFDAIDLCIARTDALRSALVQRMPDDPPDFRQFESGLNELAGKRPKPAAAAPSGVAGGGESGAGHAPGTFSTGDVQDIAGAMNAILGAGAFIRKADPTSPIPYAVNRIAKWAKIQLPVTDDARTQIEPPEKTVVEALAHQMTNRLWDHLLNGAEGAFRSSDPLWLDLQRYVCAAMSGLGPDFEAARHTVVSLTASLISRLGDGIYELRFRNGSPLCSGETKMWIETEVVAARGSGTGGGSNGTGQENERLAEATTEARKLVGSGKLKEALQVLSNGLFSSKQTRERFLWRLRIAQVCFDAQRHQLAAPLLEECDREIQKHGIDEWEPMLAVDVASMLYRCRKAAATGGRETDPDTMRSIRDSFSRLCQLDPLAALTVEPSGN